MMRTPRRTVLSILVILGLLGGQVAVAATEHDDTPIVVGSLSFSESIILSEMLALLLEDAGYSVERSMDMGVSEDLHAALVDGEIDLYVEYTGGGLVAILGLPVPAGGTATPAILVEEQTWKLVSERYAEEFGLT